MTDQASARGRRYLLRNVTDDESLAIERDYMQDERAADAIAAAEDDLIEDYLDGVLTAGDRARFEREYLSSPVHRQRVDVVRRLRDAAARHNESPRAAATPFATRRRSPAMRVMTGVLAAAAVVILAVGALMWSRSRTAGVNAVQSAVKTSARPSPTAPRAAAPRVFAFAVPADTLRGGGEATSLVIPVGTDIVALEVPRRAGQITPAAGAIQAVDGAEIWRGPVAARGSSTVRFDVPARLLEPDDYIVSLVGPDGAALDRYVLHVGAQ